MPEGLVGLPGGCCLIAGPERQGEAGRSETRAGILRLGAALVGKADAGPGGGMACTGLCQACPVVGMGPCGALPVQLVSGRRWPAGRKKALHAEASSFPMGGQASGTVLGRAYGHVCHWAGMPYHLKKWPEREALGKGAPHVRGAPSVDVRFVCVRS